MICPCPYLFCCGFKVLYRNEFLNFVFYLLISRFPGLSKYFISDFACLLHASAINFVWWTLSDTAIVSNRLHAKNHKGCSHSFLPLAHTDLGRINSVSHEQKNIVFKRLERSPRNSNQELYTSLLAHHNMISNIHAQTRTTKRYEQTTVSLYHYDIEWFWYYCLNISWIWCR